MSKSIKVHFLSELFNSLHYNVEYFLAHLIRIDTYLHIHIFSIMLKLLKCFYHVAIIYLILALNNLTEALRYNPQGSGDENCETIKSEIHLIKEEFDELGRMQRTCNADVIVNKCEGLCNSQVQPSVITPTGFLKVS